MRNIILFSLSIVLFGCTTTSSTKDIVPVGNDTYMVGRAGSIFIGSGSEVKAQLYRDANNFCVSKGKGLMSLSDSHKDKIIGVSAAAAELKFRCVDEK